MKKTLEDIRDELEDEIYIAESLSEIMLLLHTGIHGFARNGITFEKVSGAFSLIAKISDEHVRSLNGLANALIDFQNDLQTK